jgi:hypothetical protein
VETERTVIRNGQMRISHHFVRLPTAPELGIWLHNAGFHDIQITARDLSPLTINSRRLLATARA